MNYQGNIRAKVGEVITPIDSALGYTEGNNYVVRRVACDGEPYFIDDDGKEWGAWGNEWALVPTLYPNDTVRLKSSEPFTTGNYTACVDSVRDDIVLLKHGSWLPLDAVEKVEGLTVEVGKTYVAANGELVTIVDALAVDGFIRKVGDGFVWNTNGACRHARDGDASPWRLVREAPAAGPGDATSTDLIVTLSVDTSSLTNYLADQFQRIADALRAA